MEQTEHNGMRLDTYLTNHSENSACPCDKTCLQFLKLYHCGGSATLNQESNCSNSSRIVKPAAITDGLCGCAFYCPK